MHISEYVICVMLSTEIQFVEIEHCSFFSCNALKRSGALYLLTSFIYPHGNYWQKKKKKSDPI